MLRGGVKSDNSRPARKTAGDGAAADRVLGAKNRTRDNRQPRQHSRMGLVALMDQIPVLTAEDRKQIDAAGDEAITLAHLQRHVALQIACTTRFLESGEMAAKDVIIALNKIGSQISSAVQLAASTSAATPSEIVITWGDGNRRTAPPSADRPARAVKAADAVAGDLVECD